MKKLKALKIIYMIQDLTLVYLHGIKEKERPQTKVIVNDYI